MVRIFYDISVLKIVKVILFNFYNGIIDFGKSKDELSSWTKLLNEIESS